MCSSSCSYTSGALSTERVSVQETEAPSYPYQWEARQTSFPRPSSCQSYTQESETECPLAVTALRDYVTTEDRCFAYGFVKDVVREDRERDEDEREESDKNEGILFKQVILNTPRHVEIDTRITSYRKSMTRRQVALRANIQICMQVHSQVIQAHTGRQTIKIKTT